ncbi:TlpA family protein disulfide reductase [bacterium]|nr:TlpA family protein disulfide reductase [bacterium]
MSVDLFHFLINTTAILRLALLTFALGVSTSAAQQPLVTPNQPDRDVREVVQPEVSTTPPTADATRTGILTLIDGSQVPGQLRPTNDAAVVQWLASGFTTPFAFQLEAIESIKYPRLSSAADGLKTDEFAIEFSNRDIVYGNIVSWAAGFVTIQTQSFGDLRVPTECITRLYRVQENETVLFARFKGLESWSTPQWQTTGWQEAGNYLSTEQRGAVLNGDLGVPIRSVIELTLSWKDQADFVISLGSDVTSTKDESIDGWRLETAGQKLVAVRESKDAANLAFITDLSLRRDLRLTFYLDRAAGTLHVMRNDGKLLATLLTPKTLVSDRSNAAPKTVADGAGETESTQTGIRIVNRGKHLTVERVSIARWLGELPNAAAEADALVALNDGTFAAGNIEGIESGKLSIGQNSPTSRVNWNQVTAITFRKPDPPPAPAQCALFLQNGIRLSGSVESVNEANCNFVSANSEAPSIIPRKDIRSLIVFTHDPKPADLAANDGIKGQLEIGELRLAGILAPTGVITDPDAEMQFKWRPYGGVTAAHLKPRVAGNILYRKVPKAGPKNAQARAQELQRLRIKQQQRGLNFGELFLKRADEVKTPKIERDAHVVHVRSGDVFSCRVDRIDETGVHVSTIDSKNGFVSHEEIKAIEYVTNTPPPDLEAAKRERLLTVPRLQKTAPPTHILCSHNGDFLRCRLISANADTIRVEVQLTEIKLPRDRVAQIIWLHPEASLNQGTAPNESQDAAAPSESSIYDGLVQVLLRDGKRITFKPNMSTETHVSGESAIIGPCSFPLENIDELILGNQILTEVTDLAYNRWKLQSAIEPLVTAAMEQGDDPSSTLSSLIGQPAPEVSLQLLDGSPFKLSEQTGKIVVLDFWATWCAPCMQTMPLVERAMEQFDPDKVKLISVNLQESVQQIQPVLERYNLNLTVALDTDGVAAARYEARAIPQLVIIGKDGIVEQLYVGGGPTVVNQMSESIQAMLSQDPE